ncbi:TrmB family transcriptional regulator [Nanoarchaeota archaeon]
MEEQENILKEIGLSKNESKVYLTLIKNGGSTACKIAEISHVYRANVYEALDKLIRKGFATYITKNKTKIFHAASPNSLLLSLKEKENKLMSILPSMELNHELAEVKGEAQIFEGVKSFTKVLTQLLTYNETINLWGIPKVSISKLKYFISNWHRERIRKKIHINVIYNSNASDRVDYLNENVKYHGARSLPPEYDTTVETGVCGDLVLLIDWRDPITIILIKNQNLADAYKMYFNVLWDKAKPGKIKPKK